MSQNANKCKNPNCKIPSEQHNCVGCNKQVFEHHYGQICCKSKCGQFFRRNHKLRVEGKAYNKKRYNKLLEAGLNPDLVQISQNEFEEENENDNERASSQSETVAANEIQSEENIVEKIIQSIEECEDQIWQYLNKSVFPQMVKTTTKTFSNSCSFDITSYEKSVVLFQDINKILMQFAVKNFVIPVEKKNEILLDFAAYYHSLNWCKLSSNEMKSASTMAASTNQNLLFIYPKCYVNLENLTYFSYNNALDFGNNNGEISTAKILSEKRKKICTEYITFIRDIYFPLDIQQNEFAYLVILLYCKTVFSTGINDAEANKLFDMVNDMAGKKFCQLIAITDFIKSIMDNQIKPFVEMNNTFLDAKLGLQFAYSIDK